jgi:predicted RecB family nuclease
VNATDIKKLKEHGLHTVASVLMHTKKQLMDIKGVTDKKVEQLIAAANKVAEFTFVR